MIELKNVTKTYGGGFTALEDVNLQIADGEFVFIVGGSGAGKSTLARLLIAEDKPTAGSISVNEWDLTSLKKKKIPYYRRRLGIVFRDFRLFSDKTVYENVAFALRVIGEHSASIRMKVSAALRMVELSEKGKCYPDQLTGEEQQRVALARALAGSPDVIIADEPTGNIDPVQSRSLMELFCRIQSRYSKTVVVLTHERELAESFGCRVVYLQRGKIVDDVAANRLDEELLAEMERLNRERAAEERIESSSDGATASDYSVDFSATAVFTPIAMDLQPTDESTEAQTSESTDASADEPTAEVADASEAETETVSEVESVAETETESESKPIAEIETEAETEEPSEANSASEGQLSPDTAETVTEAAAEQSELSDEAILSESEPEALPAVEAISILNPPFEIETEDTFDTENAPETEGDPETEEPAKTEGDPETEETSAPTAPAAEEGAQVRSYTISTDALEAALSDLFNGVSIEDSIATDHRDAPAEAVEFTDGEQEEQR